MTTTGPLRSIRASRHGAPRHATVARGHLADGGTAGDAPFGLPVLDELPELAAVLTQVTEADHRLVAAVLALRRLLADGPVESATGVGLDHWLAATARMAGLDRRLLRRMCRLLDRLPSLADGAAHGKVSFTQLRALTLELHACPVAIDGPLDAWLGAAIEQLPEDADPDVLVKQAARAADEFAPEVLDEQSDFIESQRGLTIQPFLDGTGGTFHGIEDAPGLALLEAATAPSRDQLDGGIARARGDNLLRRLAHTCPEPTDRACKREGVDAGVDTVGHDAGHAPGSDACDGERAQPEALPAPRLLLRCELDTLLDEGRLPVDVLTRLVGGRLRLTSDQARRLIEARGASIRAIIVDGGEVVGVGRATNVPPGWLRDATLAIHQTCTAPLCDRPALGADVDHAVPWHPEPDRPGGRTDIDQLGPLCDTTNRAKRASGWRSDQTARGIRTWRHPRSGLTITTVPSTWRPAGLPPPAPRPRPGRVLDHADLTPPADDDGDPF